MHEVALFLSLLCNSPTHSNTPIPFQYAFPAHAQGTKVAGIKVPPFHVDDNFVVPIFSALCATKIFGLISLPAFKLSPYIVFRKD